MDKQRISSGNKKTDILFKRIIDTLNSDEIEAVHLVKSLRDPDRRSKRKYLCGYIDGEGIIFLSKDKRKNRDIDEIAQTLLHEVLHAIFPENSENMIYDKEKHYWLSFSEKQKEILKFYIPKKISRIQPTL